MPDNDTSQVGPDEDSDARNPKVGAGNPDTAPWVEPEDDERADTDWEDDDA